VFEVFMLKVIQLAQLWPKIPLQLSTCTTTYVSYQILLVLKT